ncbi:uncharacterized protein LOC126834596 isoform X2 [Adelges cooleyi]|nr:uncharacterized protein LOC126834596 isoform X2 [Adelges cooleyi]
MENTCQNEVEELFLYHATSTSNINSIAEFNLDWRCTSRSRYGKGVNFSHCPIYANRYASYATVCDEVTIDVLTKMGFPKEAIKRAVILSYGSLENATKWLMEHIMDPDYAENALINDDEPVERTFVLCSVLCQKVKEVGVSYNLKVIPNFYDTARSRNGNVWIKFNDFEFYPYYVIQYKERSTTNYDSNIDFSVDTF